MFENRQEVRREWWVGTVSVGVTLGVVTLKGEGQERPFKGPEKRLILIKKYCILQRKMVHK